MDEEPRKPRFAVAALVGRETTPEEQEAALRASQERLRAAVITSVFGSYEQAIEAVESIKRNMVLAFGSSTQAVQVAASIQAAQLQAAARALQEQRNLGALAVGQALQTVVDLRAQAHAFVPYTQMGLQAIARMRLEHERWIAELFATIRQQMQVSRMAVQRRRQRSGRLLLRPTSRHRGSLKNASTAPPDGGDDDPPSPTSRVGFPAVAILFPRLTLKHLQPLASALAAWLAAPIPGAFSF